MSNSANDLDDLLQQMHARISRLEIAAVALTKSLADSQALPADFSAVFTRDLEAHIAATAKAEKFQRHLSTFGSKWSELFQQLQKRS
ncbi:hypothetical protein [Stenotrophomonas pavanii]|uniref:hypothetical protein n=1 Tax=Stenotrophomonas pavanii TaxID=487698 RepID=UPI0039C7265D